ncbi:MAG: hypothetical protein K0S47_3971 [Herbinix sp.]|jgi:inorganic pyrophosphatase/exopolyphosphatase|nr:hypothetical protein [Herbinix sp.]
MDDKTFRYKNEIVGVVQLQVMDKIITKEITLEEKNYIMEQMLEKDCDFLLLGTTFINKKAIYIIDFPQRQQEVVQ